MKILKVGLLSLAMIGMISINAKAEEITVGIEGMTCQACVNKVTERLMAINGIEKVEVDLENKTANLKVSDDMHIPESLIKTVITSTGFVYTGGDGFMDMMPQEVQDVNMKVEEAKQTAENLKNTAEETKKTVSSFWDMFK